jgi:protein-S-isoprenylcysteine O-methyltransferase Ste14
MLPLVLLSYPAWVDDSIMFEILELGGITLLLVCTFGRLWSILYSGSKKNVELVTRGPYSISRNPLYLFSSIGAFGIGLMFASLTL